MKSVTVSSARPYFRSFAVAGLLGALSLSMAVGLLASSAWLISMAALQPPILALQVAVVSVRFFGLGRGVFRYAERVLSHDAILRATTALQLLIYRALLRRQPFTSSTARLGKLLGQLGSDVESVQDRWIRLVIPFVGAAISGWAGISILFWLAPKIALAVSLLFMIALITIPIFVAQNSLGNAGAIFESEVRISDQVANACRAHLEAEIYGYQEQLGKALEREENAIIQRELRLIRNSGLGSSTHLLLTYLAVITAFVLGVKEFQIGELSGVNIAVVTLLPLVIFDGIPALISPLATAGKIRRATRSIDELVAPVDSYVGSAELISDALTLTLLNARAKWFGAELSHKPVTGRFQSGEMALIKGESGIGKSSLALSIAGLLDYEGSIQLDGVEVRDLSSASLRRAMTVLLQDEHLFASSIRENLKIARPEVEDAQIWQALEAVELRELIESLPEGLDTIIGAFGTNFSGGERQRIRLARVFLRKTSLYVLDEPFEHLEVSQALKIQVRLFEHCRNSTLVIISHQEIAQAQLRIALSLD